MNTNLTRREKKNCKTCCRYGKQVKISILGRLREKQQNVNSIQRCKPSKH